MKKIVIIWNQISLLKKCFLKKLCNVVLRSSKHKEVSFHHYLWGYFNVSGSITNVDLKFYI